MGRGRLYRCALATAVAYLMTSAIASQARSAVQPVSGIATTHNPTQEENLRPGTPESEWRLTDPGVPSESIDGYASLTSVNRGDRISLLVSANPTESSYTIDVYRLGWYQGNGARLVLGGITRPATAQPPCPVDTANAALVECHWNDPYVLTIPDSWVSGIYLAKLTPASSGKQGYIPFVVRDDLRASTYVFQSSVTTGEAYNIWGGHSLYDNLNALIVPTAHKVSFNRPYAKHAFAPLDSRGSGQLMVWEYPMVRWLERAGYDVTYVTNVDVHRDPRLLVTHRAFLSVGHDEYWSWEMRRNLQDARDRGANLGFFSANTGYWQVRLEPATAKTCAADEAPCQIDADCGAGGPCRSAPDRTIVAYKRADLDPIDAAHAYLTTVQFRQSPVLLPEDALLGTMFNGLYFVGPGNWGDIVVTQPEHWVYEGTGLRASDRLPNLLGYEEDRSGVAGGAPPPGLTVIASSPVTRVSNVHGADFCGVPGAGETSAEFALRCPNQRSDMTVYQAGSGATVFAAGFTNWAFGLDGFDGPAHYCGQSPACPGCTSCVDRRVQRMTRNILTRLALPHPVQRLVSTLDAVRELFGSDLCAACSVLEGTLRVAWRAAGLAHPYAPGMPPPSVVGRIGALQAAGLSRLRRLEPLLAAAATSGLIAPAELTSLMASADQIQLDIRGIVPTDSVTFAVSGLANLYQGTNPETRDASSIDPIVVPGARLCPGQSITVVATGCVAHAASPCTGADGDPGRLSLRGLPAYGLIGRWSRSPNGLDASTAASAPFFVGAETTLLAPPDPAEYYLFLGQNDDVFVGNTGAGTVTAEWTQATSCSAAAAVAR